MLSGDQHQSEQNGVDGSWQNLVLVSQEGRLGFPRGLSDVKVVSVSILNAV